MLLYIMLAPYDTATQMFEKLAELLGCSPEAILKLKDVSACLNGIDKDTKANMLLSIELLRYCEDSEPEAPEVEAFIASLHVALIQDPALIEVSGMQVSEKSGLYLFTVQDSANPSNWQAISLTSGLVLVDTPIGTYNQIDIEDMTADGTYLYFLDAGNNAGARTSFNIVRVLEPDSLDILTGSAVTPASVTQAYTLNAGDPAGNNPDAETLIYLNGRFYVITKRGQTSFVYVTPESMVFGGASVELEYVGAIGLANGIPHDATEGYDAVINGGDAKGDRIIIKTYTGIYENIRLPGVSDANMILGGYDEITAYVGHGDYPNQEPKGEALSFNDDAVFTVSEGYAPIINKLIHKPVTTTIFQQGTDAYAGATDNYLNENNPGNNNAADTSFAIEGAANKQQGIIHFDAIAAPAGHEVLGGYLEFNIDDAGSGFQIFRMIGDFVALIPTMTWNNTSLGNGFIQGIDFANFPMGGHGAASAVDHVTVGVLRIPISATNMKALLLVNYGIALMPFIGGDNVLGALKSNDATVADRPILAIYSTPS